MVDREPMALKRLLERLLSTRARRDREARFSEPWKAADAELHAIEREIFQLPTDWENLDGANGNRRLAG